MRKFTCTPQVYRARPGAGFASSLYTFPHSLGVEPQIIRGFLKCLTPDLGFPAGAITPIDCHAVDRIYTGAFLWSYAATGFAVQASATDLIVSFDTNQGMSIHKFDAKTNGRIKNSAWEIIMKVYAP